MSNYENGSQIGRDLARRNAEMDITGYNQDKKTVSDADYNFFQSVVNSSSAAPHEIRRAKAVIARYQRQQGGN